MSEKIKLRSNALVIINLLLFTIASSSFAKTLQGKVVKIADGDTLTILDVRGFKYRVRLAGIDDPERENPRAVAALVDKVNPASVAEPPLAPVIEAPSKPN